MNTKMTEILFLQSKYVNRKTNTTKFRGIYFPENYGIAVYVSYALITFYLHIKFLSEAVDKITTAV